MSGTRINNAMDFKGNPYVTNLHSHVDPSNVALDENTDIAGKDNLAGGLPLEIVAYNSANLSVMVQPVSTVAQHDRWTDIYYKNGENYVTLSSGLLTALRKGAFIFYGANNAAQIAKGKFVTDIADVISLIASAKSAQAQLNIRLVNTDGTIAESNAVTITYASMNKTLYVKESENSDVYTDITTASGFCRSSQSDYADTDEKFCAALFYEDGAGKDLYIHPNSNDWTGITLQKYKVASCAKFCKDTNIGSAYEVTGTLTTDVTFQNGKKYYTLKNGVYEYTGVTTGETVAADTYYELTGTLTADTVYSCGKNYYTLSGEIYTVVTPSHFLLVLDRAIETDETMTSALDSLGTLEDPMLAAVGSMNGDFSASVIGDSNASVGFNSFTGGNSNHNLAHFCYVFGLDNINAGELSLVYGVDNKNYSVKSVVLGGSNVTGGDTNYVIGTANRTHGYYALTVGCMNTVTGVSQLAIGHSNRLYGNRSIAVGSRITIGAKATDSLGIGNHIEVNQKEAIAIGTSVTDAAENKDGVFFPGVSIRTRKAVLNPLYNPENDLNGTGTDSDNNAQYESSEENAYSLTYKGHLLTETETIATAGNITLDHDLFARWNLTASGEITLALANWKDGDSGELIVDTTKQTISIPAEWVTLGADITTTPGVYVLEIAQVGTTIFYAIKYPNSGGTITSIGDHIKITGGYWYIDGVNTGVKAQGTDGKDADNITVDSVLSSTSTNPVQNKVINTALASKAASSHTHSYLPLAGGTMTGVINRNGVLAGNPTNGGFVSLQGGTSTYNNGGALVLYDKGYADNGGNFLLQAGDGTNVKGLRGKPDGTLTWGNYNVLRDYFTRADNTGTIQLFSGTDYLKGGYLRLHGISNSESQGGFRIGTGDGTTNHELFGTPDGQLTWDGETILNDMAHSTTANGYVKLTNGLIIQWGRGNSVNGETSVETQFPITFPTACLRVVASPFCSNANAGVDGWIQVMSYDTSKFTYFGQYSGDVGGIACDYIAIGY